MKKITVILVALIFTGTIQAQNIENPSFDSVFIGGIDRIYQWITSDAWFVTGGDTVAPFAPDSDYVSVGLQHHELLHSVQLEYSGAYDGPFAIQLFADTSRVDIFGAPFPGFIVNGNHFFTDSNGYINLNKCGSPFTFRPDKLRGHYQYEDQSPSLSNYPRAYLLLKKYNVLTHQSDTVGYGSLSMQLFPTASWRLFEMPLTYLNSQIPDSIVVAFFAPRLAYPATFKVDSLGFEYSTVNIEDAGKSSAIHFYFNGNKLHFENTGEISSLNIFDASGKLIVKSKGVNEIDLSEIRGVYFMSIRLKNGLLENHKFYLKE